MSSVSKECGACGRAKECRKWDCDGVDTRKEERSGRKDSGGSVWGREWEGVCGSGDDDGAGERGAGRGASGGVLVVGEVERGGEEMGWRRLGWGGDGGGGEGGSDEGGQGSAGGRGWGSGDAC